MDDINLFSDIKKHIKLKLNNNHYDFFGDTYKNERNEVLQLIQRSVETRESNSAILVGPPGCGKTSLVKNVIKELTSQSIINEENCAVVWLNGLLHTDDRIALQDIARQLKQHVLFEDTSESLKSFGDSLQYMLRQFQTSNTNRPCMLLILDEFHLFTEHKDQRLLYNLFDSAQAAKSPLCVLCLTYFTDGKDLLEKRLLSRFSNRQIHMNKAVTLEDRLGYLNHVLTLTPLEEEGDSAIYAYLWNDRIENLVKSDAVRHILAEDLDLNPCHTRFRNKLFQLFNTITFEEPLLSVEGVLRTFSSEDFYIRMISRLSALEVALLIAIKQHSINYDREPFNFEMILTQYMKFVQQHASTMITVRAVIVKAYQRLQEMELIVPVKKGPGSAKIPLDFQLYQLMLTETQIVEGVKANKTVSADLQQWAAEAGSA